MKLFWVFVGDGIEILLSNAMTEEEQLEAVVSVFLEP